MFWKLLLTAAVILGAVLVIRARMRRGDAPAGGPGSALPPGQVSAWSSRGILRVAAYVLVGLALLGTAVHLVGRWDAGREVLEVQVVNANTGVITRYEARRRDIEGRGFRTLEGQTVRLADVERMILTATSSSAGP
jgi:hypothetical protein